MSSCLAQAVKALAWLSYSIYTEAIKNMKVSQLWSVLYFFMLLLLGIGSMLGSARPPSSPLSRTARSSPATCPRRPSPVSGPGTKAVGLRGRAGAVLRTHLLRVPATSSRESCRSCQALWERNSPRLALHIMGKSGGHPNLQQRPGSPPWPSKLSRHSENLLLSVLT